MIEMLRTIEQSQRQLRQSLIDVVAPVSQLSRQLAHVLAPLSQISKDMANFNLGLPGNLATIQREMRLATDMLRNNALGMTIPAKLMEDQRWKKLRLDLGVSQWAESIVQAQKQWNRLADLAGLRAHITESTLGPLLALQRRMETSRIDAGDLNDTTGAGTHGEVNALTAEQVETLFNENFDVHLVPLLNELKTIKSEVAATQAKVSKSATWKRVQIIWVLFQILCNLATLDGWQITRFGNQGMTPDLALSPEKAQQLRESMEIVIAFGRRLQGSERTILRTVDLRRTPKGAKLQRKAYPGQVVQVMDERHEWIAVTFEIDDEWISGWVMKKYTEVLPNEDRPTTSKLSK